MKIFVSTKIRPFSGPFWLKNWPFSLKIRFLDIFFETAHQICLKLGQKLETVALNHLLVVFCLGKFLIRPVYPFLGQKYNACGDVMRFLAVLLFSCKLFMLCFELDVADFFCPNFDFGHRQDTITLRWGFQAGWIFKAFRRPKKPTLIPPPVPESDPTPREGYFRWGRVTFRQRGIFRREMFSGRGNSGL